MSERPWCFAVCRGGRWFGICRHGTDEHTTPEGYDTSELAIEAAKAIAARLLSTNHEQKPRRHMSKSKAVAVMRAAEKARSAERRVG